MSTTTNQTTQARRFGRGLAVIVFGLGLLVFVGGSTTGARGGAVPAERAAIAGLAARWCEAAAAHDAAAFDLLSRASRDYYPRLKQSALTADAEALQELDPIDQLQVMFLRLMLDTESLEAMDGRALVGFALEHGLIGQDLRRGDALEEISVESDAATGRLYKFGLADRPDRGLQYFVKEDGGWRIELRGELERLRGDFRSFLARTGLSPSEAAFFILELRLMRKVTPADFVAPLASTLAEASVRAERADRQRGEPAAEPILRLVAIRHGIAGKDALAESAATIEDRVESIRSVLRVGDRLPADPRLRLARIDRDSVVLRTRDGERILRLERSAEPLSQRFRRSQAAGSAYPKSLLQQAEQGKGREGMMAQWRNVGMRDRPQLLQQGWLTADYADATGPDRRMRGLRVRKLIEGSFWQQIGLEEGDLLEEVNGLRVDSTEAWRRVLEIAQTDRAITITVDRSARRQSYRTETIRPR